MINITAAGCIAEILTFIIDGRMFPGGVPLSYLLNSFCFIGTCSIGFLWCLYVDYRIHNSDRSIRKKAGILFIPLALEILLLCINFSGCGVIFLVSEANVYSRGSLVALAYLILFFYFFYSIFILEKAKRKGLHIMFFPICYFVVPCMAGTIVQGLLYGLTIGWTTVAVSLLFVYLQLQSFNSYVDPLSGLFNRRYMDNVLSRLSGGQEFSLYGIMIDMNNFKNINDSFGHSKGDEAIRKMGEIISDSVSGRGLAFRYAGDEFIILLRTNNEDDVKRVMRLIENNTDKFNLSLEEPYTLSFAMGYSRYDAAAGGVEKFMYRMDMKMYEAKQKHYRDAENNT
ncbi:MAG: GGDEF domain-containing protein [Bacillota bacterium]|nr:GGDEF domain-containing protein [Bacillota bacterium]